MFIDIENKNGSLVDRIETTATTTPRVGEEIVLPAPDPDLQGAQRLMVFEVYHELDDGLLATVVRCRPTRGGDENVAQARLELLEELGWLRG